MELIPTPRL